jgi:glucuronoarabinoxylan endo-1,4-beta-xylanase
MKHFRILMFILALGVSQGVEAQAVTVTWTNTHQTIDGFGGGNTSTGASMSTADENFFFGTGASQLGLSILRVGLTDGNYDPGDCTTVSASCAGAYVNDMKAVVANGGRVLATSFSPPAAYKTNGSTICTAGAGNGALSTGSYGAYATWIANFVQSVQAQGASVYAVSVQNEPEICQSYDSALWTAAQMDTFIKTNLGPTLSSAGLTPSVFLAETDVYSDLSSYAGTCMSDPSCYQYVGGNNWHDYDATYPSINSTTNPWASLGKKFWQTEGSCLFQSFCTYTPFVGNMADALPWAGLIDDRLANANVNSWLWLDLEDWFNDGSNIGLTENDSSATIAKRAYVLGQYSKFVRPGWVRIDATHNPTSGVFVTAFRDPSSGNFAIVAINENSSSSNVTFSLAAFPSVTSVIPTLTSDSLNLIDQASSNVSGGAFSYSLPATSVVTFHGTASSASSQAPAPPSGLSAIVN